MSVDAAGQPDVDSGLDSGELELIVSSSMAGAHSVSDSVQ